MHLKYFVLLAYTCFSFTTIAFDAAATSIRGKVRATPGSTVVLYDYHLHVSDTVAQAEVGTDSIFIVSMPANSYHGFYRLVWENGGTDLLYSGEPISFSVPQDEIEVIRGDAWRNYRALKLAIAENRHNQGQLNALLTGYQGESRALKAAAKQLKKLRKAEQQLEKTIRGGGQADLAHRHLRFEWPFIGMNPDLLGNAYSRERYLDLVDLSDTVQLHYNLLPQHIVEYFRMFEPGAQEDQEILTISFVNRVFEKLDENPAYVKAVGAFLRLGFEQMNQPKALNLINQKLATHFACTDPQLGLRRHADAAAFAAIAAGAQAPTIGELEQAGGNMTAWEPSAGLLVFWSSECPDCLYQFPDLHLWLKNNHPDLKVTAIGLDSYGIGWQAEAKQLEHWTHFRDPKAWGGAAAELYLVQKAPFFVRIDGQGKIIATYRNVADLRASLTK